MNPFYSYISILKVIKSIWFISFNLILNMVHAQKATTERGKSAHEPILFHTCMLNAITVNCISSCCFCMAHCFLRDGALKIT